MGKQRSMNPNKRLLSTENGFNSYIRSPMSYKILSCSDPPKVASRLTPSLISPCAPASQNSFSSPATLSLVACYAHQPDPALPGLPLYPCCSFQLITGRRLALLSDAP
ncbi:hypothetical protein GOP47_0009090 [Adiantum capillus-veneris]|uniref:Uncharacterized protein n=1 Tax=Adiantum capillus-veneris TaxID=13818 RepID=A0A9D4UZK2_ADICA|nr:hypothetical protein GOP47_0009090 [Adiantum capillus-veneris]